MFPKISLTYLEFSIRQKTYIHTVYVCIMDEFDEFSLVTKLDQQKLVHLILSIPGTKELIVEANLIRPLDKICRMSMLKNQNCLHVHLLHMDKSIICGEEIEQRIFFVRPTIAIARKICEIIRSDQRIQYSVIQVDGHKNLFFQEFERYGLHGMVNFLEFYLTLIHLESDLFSLELPQYSPNKFSHYFEPMARTLWQLQTLYGQINTTFGIGGESFNGIRKKIRHISKQLGEPAASADQPISHLFIFDRRIDLASILLTGLTYESILNDAFTYNCGKIVFGPDVDQKLSRRQNPSATTISGQTTLTPKTYSLNNADPIFSSIRNSHMTVVFSFLKAKAKLLQSSFDRISAIQNVDEMKKFVANELGSLREQQKQLEIHICACEHLLETMKGFNEKFEVEHAIIRGEYEDFQVFSFLQKMTTAKANFGHVLMLATLWCLRSDGVPSKYYRQLQKAFLHRYGFERIVTFYELRIHGLLYEKEGITTKMTTTIKTTKIPFAGNRIAEYKYSDHLNQGTQAGRPSSMFCATLNGFRLFQTAQTRVARKQQSSPETSNVLSPSEAGSSASELETAKGLGFVFSDAYIPLISYLVDRTVTKGWEETILRKVLGEHNVHCSNPQARAPDNRIRRAILVCFVGGVTYAEIASIRSFAQNRDFRIIILTTHIINREEFLKSFTNIVC